MDRGRHSGAAAPGLHELEHGRLSQNVLQDHPVGPHLQITPSRDKFLVFRIVQVGKQKFVGQRHRPTDPATDDFQVAPHCLVYFGNEFRS